MVTAIPTLDQLADDPTLAERLPASVARSLIFRCIAALSGLAAASATAPVTTAPEHDERLISFPEVADMIGMSESWVEKNTASLPPRRVVGGKPLWRKAEIHAWIRNRPLYGKLRVATRTE